MRRSFKINELSNSFVPYIFHFKVDYITRKTFFLLKSIMSLLQFEKEHLEDSIPNFFPPYKNYYWNAYEDGKAS